MAQDQDYLMPSFKEPQGEELYTWVCDHCAITRPKMPMMFKAHACPECEGEMRALEYCFECDGYCSCGGYGDD